MLNPTTRASLDVLRRAMFLHEMLPGMPPSGFGFLFCHPRSEPPHPRVRCSRSPSLRPSVDRHLFPVRDGAFAPLTLASGFPARRLWHQLFPPLPPTPFPLCCEKQWDSGSGINDNSSSDGRKRKTVGFLLQGGSTRDHTRVENWAVDVGGEFLKIVA